MHMETRLDHLIHDPRPDEPDTRRWRAALLLVYRLGLPPARAVELASRLWTMRQMGTSIARDRSGFRFQYLPKQWVDAGEFEEFKRLAFSDFRVEVQRLLAMIDQVDRREVPEVWKHYT